ncbi:MAG: bifunctional folylpolyglutamate synthase/dihydrofolate synthase [Betaproteobacteria bacterium RIFCSPLOWO2_02_FULL_67_19]|nr:MAG: bifunctional folylpolyglutamate synthase/dihydrofolate synthase [Betaproteobacteria bacterium RIFCSPLOWO2_02_FULL_67_19]
MSARSLQDWLEFIERQHPQPIALGLGRVREVLGRLGTCFTCPAFTVAGTNGKGSTTAMLESILRAAGYRVGMYTSPHLLHYGERVRILGREADDAALCEAFAAVEQARGQVPLTYFEFGTLAAAWLFARERLDAVVLEVGLGGRLDAVNVFDADCAVLTSVALDHVDYLGDSRESIGCEKAGIFRPAKPAVVVDPEPPAGALAEARRIGAQLLLLGQDFGYVDEGATQWSYWGPSGRRSGLAHPALRGGIQLRNASGALAALDAMRAALPVGMQDIRRGLANVTLAGRFQVIPGRPQIVLDVAHNPEAAAVLAQNLAASGYSPQTIAVFAMLRDKDIAGVARALAPRITRWHVAGLGGARGASAEQVAVAAAAGGVTAPVQRHANPAAALAAAQSEAGENDKIVVFGSFLTVAEAIAMLDPRTHG